MIRLVEAICNMFNVLQGQDGLRIVVQREN